VLPELESLCGRVWSDDLPNPQASANGLAVIDESESSAANGSGIESEENDTLPTTVSVRITTQAVFQVRRHF